MIIGDVEGVGPMLVKPADFGKYQITQKTPPLQQA
jgi:hypothetical protein